MAYEHVSVRCEDHRSEVIEFGGRFFVECCLTFGGANSPTIYHLPASLLKSMAELKSGLDPCLNIMQLDDNCSCDKKGSGTLRCYREEYRSVASRLGIRLANEDNPSKAFPPSCMGKILGLMYNTELWTWNMTEAKRVRLQILLAKGIRHWTLLNGEAQVLAGKINHYSNIIWGKFERCLIIHIVKEAKGKKEEVVVGKQASVQLTWWLLNPEVSFRYALRKRYACRHFP
jgi:hypothetical protein